ncbi:ras-like protein family member 11A [Eurytemora carolleeae]|uniref:ras-like protein family member 11A n=1 Tax=Eurytemora carolleeae TaxID=1294199 RepID=UPI000C766ABB|nr:ras-like protein family member 11A [Eurytemora carolleeae]|eukprot:XP_023323433.1 ras-like protein family member 11A [Eurytemora affinis]
MSSKSSPKSPSSKSAFKIFRGFSRKHRKALKVSVLGDQGAGKSAFVVRYLTRRFIGDYCSKMENTYPHTSLVDNIITPILVWDTIQNNQDEMRDRLYTITSWADVIIILYSVTDIQSYNTSLYIYNTILSTMSLELDHFPAPIILVGNKNDLWHQRQVVTDLACQEAKDLGFANFFEISVKESLDQVRIVFEEAIRRGAVTRRQRQGHTRGKGLRQSISSDFNFSEETSPESEDGSPKNIPVPSNILQTIKKKLTSPKSSVSSSPVLIPQESENTNSVPRSRSYTYSGKFQLIKRSRKLSVFESSAETP